MSTSSRVLTLAFAFVCSISVAITCLAGTTIEYSYDRQHRLVQASCSEAEKACYSHIAASNLDVEASITDSQYLKSFLYWLSAIWPDRLEPEWLRKAKA